MFRVRLSRLSAGPLDDMRMAATYDNVILTLSRDEATVLFHFLSRYSEAPHQLRVDYQAEQRVLWNMQADLESTLHEPINNPKY